MFIDTRAEKIKRVRQLENFDLENVVTQVKIGILDDFLLRTKYKSSERLFLIDGFTNGFSIGYQGSTERCDVSNNIPFTVGDEFELWDKIMKEVELKRFAGSYEKIPFKNYIQSPVGLVPKAGNKTRLIFHLSYEFKNGNPSVNQCTLYKICTVRYNDIDHTINNCLFWLSQFEHQVERLYFGKTDLQSAFRILPSFMGHWLTSILKAVNPVTKELRYFVDKCMPFGASISCANFQRFSNALKHIMEILEKLPNSITNYLDDFLFMHFLRRICNQMLETFLWACKQINFPVSIEKTEWATEIIEFLGILLDGLKFRLRVPQDKIVKALAQLSQVTEHKKIKIKNLQQLAGTLKFLTRAVFPGRVFTRRIYSKFAMKEMTKDGKLLKPHHHVKIDQELKNDCLVWQTFLECQNSVNRPFLDLNEWTVIDKNLNFFTDASKNSNLGFGCSFGKNWTFGIWEPGFIDQFDPSIAYLELYALCVGIFTWQHRQELNNVRILIHCDNQAVVQMVNNMTSKCGNCMYLLRMLTLNNMQHNRRIFVKYINTKAI